MKEFVRQFLLGAGSIFLAPAGVLPKPRFKITVPEGTATQAIAGDFSRVGADFVRATDKIERAAQLELSI